VIVLQLAQQCDSHQLRRALEQRHDFIVPNVGEWVSARAPIPPGLPGGQRARVLDAARTALAHAGLGRGEHL